MKIIYVNLPNGLLSFKTEFNNQTIIFINKKGIASTIPDCNKKCLTKTAS